MSSNKIDVLDHGYVSLLSASGDDFDIVSSARVSVNGSSKGVECDLKLLKYLYQHKHTSPFEMVVFRFLVHAPIFVIRQWQRHRTWSYNEQSGRYSVFKIQRYIPKLYRLQDQTNRQSSYGAVELPEHLIQKRDLIHRLSDELYYEMIDFGIAREMARLDLGVSTYSSFIAKTDAHNLLHFLRLRLADDAQYETRLYARALMDLAEYHIPHTIALFREEITDKNNYNWINGNV